MDNFFRIIKDSEPVIVNEIYLFSLIPILITFFYKDKIKPAIFLKILFIFQILNMAWYLYAGEFFQYGLPFYICRFVMLTGIFLLVDKFKNNNNLFVAWATMAIIGGGSAILLPDLENYNFPHITNFLFYIGHYLLIIAGIGVLNNVKNFSINLQYIFYCCKLIMLFIPIWFINKILNTNYSYLIEFPDSIKIFNTNPFLPVCIVTLFILTAGYNILCSLFKVINKVNNIFKNFIQN